MSSVLRSPQGIKDRHIQKKMNEFARLIQTYVQENGSSSSSTSVSTASSGGGSSSSSEEKLSWLGW